MIYSVNHLFCFYLYICICIYIFTHRHTYICKRFAAVVDPRRDRSVQYLKFRCCCECLFRYFIHRCSYYDLIYFFDSGTHLFYALICGYHVLFVCERNHSFSIALSHLCLLSCGVYSCQGLFCCDIEYRCTCCLIIQLPWMCTWHPWPRVFLEFVHVDLHMDSRFQTFQEHIPHGFAHGT